MTILLVALTIFIDAIISSVIHSSFIWSTFVFIPLTSLLFLFYMSLQGDFNKVLIAAIFVGLSFDFVTHSALFLHVIIFISALFIMQIYQRHMSDSLIEMILMGLVIIFIYELLLFLFYYIFSEIQITISLWYMRRLFVTMIGNLPLMIFSYFLSQFHLKKMKELDKQKKFSERSLWRI